MGHILLICYAIFGLIQFKLTIILDDYNHIGWMQNRLQYVNSVWEFWRAILARLMGVVDLPGGCSPVNSVKYDGHKMILVVLGAAETYCRLQVD